MIRKTSRAIATELIPEISMEEQNWRTSITHKLTQPSSAVVIRELKDFALVNDEFYF